MKTLLTIIILGFYAFFLIRRAKKGAWMSIVWSILAILATVYIGIGLLLFVIQSKFVFQPMQRMDYTPEDLGLVYENVDIQSLDGTKIHGWYFPTEEAKYTILLCHGNAGNVSHRLDIMKFFQQFGLNAFVFDYRGYGKSQGKPTEEGVYMDARAAWNWLTGEKQIPADQILIHGRSLGGSVAAYLAAELESEGVKPAGVVIESAFASLVDMGHHFYPWLPIQLFVRYKLDTRACLQKIHSPVLIMHSKIDEVVPYKFGPDLYENANEPKTFKEISSTHNESVNDSKNEYAKIWKDWLKSL